MSRGDPVEFIRDNGDGTFERVGNQVQITNDMITINNASPVTITPTAVVQGALTDRSGNIVAGGTSEEVMPINSNRHYMIIQNLSKNNEMWINFGIAAEKNQPSLQLAAKGGKFVMEGSFICTQAVNIICTKSNEPYVAKEA